jgi:hypothetical protein
MPSLEPNYTAKGPGGPGAWRAQLRDAPMTGEQTDLRYALVPYI